MKLGSMRLTNSFIALRELFFFLGGGEGGGGGRHNIFALDENQGDCKDSQPVHYYLHTRQEHFARITNFPFK